eukprot:CAMPEP_0197832480 /NCGR_PEP_ID=MMETSP1437-20131217/14974_1 /TAXON_ID=49252 ORGANISM="Eucampia antarctica, Strain CCMP1452" /NCGR_SAMPLE_ID=MMETSP1437 /ASSEMBLY_ACC=CAM_ASM_001096 /LENGTH=734 /DNA_ID=CAMNT_0043435879 /DNA_START=77 /DNA_END=2281 /DNA_ORIENTATION=-
MVLPAIETNPILLLRFVKDTSPDLVTFVKERFTESGIIVLTEDITADGTVFGITSSQREIEAQAEHDNLVKPISVTVRAGAKIVQKDEKVMECFTVENREDFTKQNQGDFYDVEGLFSSSDRVRLIYSILNSINVLSLGIHTSNLSRRFDQMKIRYKDDQESETKQKSRSLLFSSKQEEEQSVNTSLFLCNVLEVNELVDLITPVHIPHLKEKIFNQVKNFWKTVPVQDIRDYYGEEIAFYFAWMRFFTDYLLFPGVLAAIIRVARYYRGDTIDNCELTPFHGIFVFLWGVLFLRDWQRQEARFAYSWGTFSSTGYQRRFFAVRPEFKGVLKVSEVTGLMELHCPSYKRQLKYVGSAIVTLVLLVGAFFVMILSLNLQGYVHEHEDNYHPFHYPWLSILAEDGHAFDSASFWKCYIPVVLHVTVVTCMNLTYRSIAEKLTTWENHETVISHENSLICKRFFFEAFDAYLILFYLAFYERDITKLRGELISLFIVDTFRRVGTECVLPYLLQNAGSIDETKAGITKKDDSITKGSGNHSYLDDLKKDEYEEFDDYLEIILQFGYVTLFASAYPFAAFVAMLANVIEVKSDLLKLTLVCRRPRPVRTDDIGTWKMFLNGIIWLSALTNCLIFAFTSKQMTQFLPGYFTVDEDNVPAPIEGKGWIIVFLVFGIERALIMSGLLINLVRSKVPEDVNVMEERKMFLKQQEYKALRSKTREEVKLEVKIKAKSILNTQD